MKQETFRNTQRARGRLLAAVLSFAASASAATVDLGGSTLTVTDLATATYEGIAFKGNTVVNGTLEVSSAQRFTDAAFTFGSGMTLNHTSGRWTVGANAKISVVDGAVVDLTATVDAHYFGRCQNADYSWHTWSTAPTLILDNGTFHSATNLYFSPHANSAQSGKDVQLFLLMGNESFLTVGGDLKLGEVTNASSKKHKTEKVTVAVTNSTLSVGKLYFGGESNLLTDNSSSFVRATFGPGADVTCRQFYVFQYPTSTVAFDGATVRTPSNLLVNFFGKGTGVSSFAGYQLLSGGLTFDVTVDFTHGIAFAPFFGPGGFTKTGSSALTYNCDAFMFTGALTVSNGTFISTNNMAASAFNVDGASSVLQLSGALTNATVSLSATAGGTLTLAGATISDTSPDLMLADGGTTDYFTRDGVVGVYSLDLLTLGPDAVVDIDANATTADAINAATTTIKATAENKATININFTDEPARGTTFLLFETDSADKFTVVPKLGSRTLRHKESVVAGRLVVTIGLNGFMLIVK